VSSGLVLEIMGLQKIGSKDEDDNDDAPRRPSFFKRMMSRAITVKRIQRKMGNDYGCGLRSCVFQLLCTSLVQASTALYRALTSALHHAMQV
jgi:hypothetical protein